MYLENFRMTELPLVFDRNINLLTSIMAICVDMLLIPGHILMFCQGNIFPLWWKGLFMIFYEMKLSTPKCDADALMFVCV